MTREGLRTVIATRYPAPLREGGWLPAIVGADDDGLYVIMFRRADQGPKALFAELISGEIGPRLGQRAPEIELSERWRRLIAPSSTMIQPSPVHTGMCLDPAQELSMLFDEMVAIAPRTGDADVEA